MNTLENLIENGIPPRTAEKMLNDYKKRIGTMSGIYKITDITYDLDHQGRDITLKCSLCGKEIHRLMICGRNKWSELIKSCPCQKEKKRMEEKSLSEKIEKNKKRQILSRVGKIFGDYKIVSVKNLEEHPKYILRCVECGAEKEVSADSFRKRTKFHCGKHYVPPIKYDQSYIGRKKNFLTVVGLTRMKNGHRAFICECDCGNITTVEPTIWERGIVKSCGCKTNEFRSQNSTVHGHSGDRLYLVWNGMKQRCYNKSNLNYENYGGRGIRVC